MCVSAHITDPRFDLDQCERSFAALLERLGGYADVGICPMVDDEGALDSWVRVSLDLLQRHKDQGRVRAIGISSHTPKTALKVVDGGLVDVIMFGVNLVGHSDESHQALYRACAEKDVGLVAMKPFFGGTLLVADGKPTGITPLQCLGYTLSQPVSTAVPGFRNLRQLREIVRYPEADEAERDFRSVLDNIHTHLAGTCVYCNHCLPCPQGIDVGNTIMMADWGRAGVTDDLRQWYAGLPAKASACTECGQCSARCPFGVEVIPRMREAVDLFER